MVLVAPAANVNPVYGPLNSPIPFVPEFFSLPAITEPPNEPVAFVNVTDCWDELPLTV